MSDDGPPLAGAADGKGAPGSAVDDDGDPDAGPPTTDGSAPPSEPRPWWRREGAAFVELFALSGFAVAQPLLDIFGRAPTQFVFRDADRSDVVVFGLVVTFALPLVLLGVEALVGLVSAAARRGLHLALVAGLVAVFTVQAARGLLDRAPLFVVAAAVGVLGAVLVARVAAVRMWVRFAAVGPIAFLALFLFASSTAPLVRGDDGGTAGVAVGSTAPAVVLVFDELPLTAVMRADGTIDDDLYPNLAALVDTSTWFRNTTTVSSSTWHAMPSLLTGQMPEDGTAPLASDHPDNLFTLLGETYDLHVSEAVTRLCPTDLCDRPPSAAPTGARPLLGDAVDVLRDRLSYTGEVGDITTQMVEAEGEPDVEPEADPGTHEAGEPDAHGDDPAGDPVVDDPPFAALGLNQLDRFRTFYDGLRADPSTLHYLHLLLPHAPYRFMPSGERYPPSLSDVLRAEDTWPEEEWLTVLDRHRMQLQVGYLDALLGEVVATLEDLGIFDEALVVVTSDHGVSFEPGGPIRAVAGQPVDAASLGELAWVPLVVKEPGQTEARVSDVNALTVDVLPTVADALDTDVPWDVDGRSLLGPERDDAAKPFHPSRVSLEGVEALPPVDLDQDEGWDRVTSLAVDRFFPPAGQDQRMWRPGAAPGSGLVGERLAEASDRLEEVDAELADPDRFTARRREGRVPTLVEAEVDVDPGEPVAVVLNGVVAAVVPARETDSGAGVEAMVDDALLRDGPQDVTFHRVRSR